jgi:hypothetical protein
MLDSSGELVDVLYAGSISNRSQGVAEKQRKNDQQRVLKFMTDHQPHVVCVGASNYNCRQLKDDIYEVLFDAPCACKQISSHVRTSAMLISRYGCSFIVFYQVVVQYEILIGFICDRSGVRF